MRLCLEASVERLAGLGEADAADLKRLVALCAEADGYEPRLEDDTGLNVVPGLHPWFLARVEAPDGHRRIVGAASIFAPGSDEAEISSCVHPLFRRQGLLGELLKAALDELRLRGVPAALLVSDSRLGFGHIVAQKLGAAKARTEYGMAMELGGGGERAEGAELEPTGLCLRPVGPEELDEAAALSAACFDEDAAGARAFIEGCLAEPGREQYLAMDPSGAIGLAAAQFKSRADGEAAEAMIFGVGVLPELRGRGLGRALMRTVLGMLGARGVRRVALEVDDTNVAALALYRSLGFVEENSMDYWRLELSALG